MMPQNRSRWGEAVLCPDARLFLRQRLDYLLLPVELDGGHRHGSHVFIAHIAVMPLLQPGRMVRSKASAFS